MSFFYSGLCFHFSVTFQSFFKKVLLFYLFLVFPNFLFVVVNINGNFSSIIFLVIILTYEGYLLLWVNFIYCYHTSFTFYLHTLSFIFLDFPDKLSCYLYTDYYCSSAMECGQNFIT